LPPPPPPSWDIIDQRGVDATPQTIVNLVIAIVLVATAAVLLPAE